MMVRVTDVCALLSAVTLSYPWMTSRSHQRTALLSPWTDVRGGEGEWLAVTAYVFGRSDAQVSAFASFTQPCFPWVVFMYICTLYSRVYLSSKCILSWT